MTAKKKTVDLLKKIVVTHKYLMKIYSELPELIALDSEIEKLITKLEN